MQNALLQKYITKNLRAKPTNFRPGDTIKVHVKIKEGDKERLQVFEGVVIARNNSGISETVTVRKISFGQGVERIFPLHSPRVDKVEVERKGAVRRAKLTYLRKRLGKGATLVKEKEGRTAAADNAAAKTAAKAANKAAAKAAAETPVAPVVA